MSSAARKQLYIQIAIIVCSILFIDQASKVWVKTNMYLTQEFMVMGLDWFRIHFTENPGMAFGMQFGGDIGKLALSIFRIFAIGFICYFIKTLIDQKAPKGFILSVSLILAGAIGNVIDSTIYGWLFEESSYRLGNLAKFVGPGNGYAPLLMGKVVDMFYFPLIDTYLPEWLPIWGGERFAFFRPVFNVADSAISVGVASILLFHRRFFLAQAQNQTEAPTES